MLSEKHSKLFQVVKLLSERAMSMSKHHFKLLEGESFQFKLSQYASKKEKNEIFLFTPFNTHPDGYKLQVGIYANGCEKGKGTHLSLSTEILKNDNDHKLQWPFQATIQYELLNQLANDKHYQIVTKFCATDDILVGRN